MHIPVLLKEVIENLNIKSNKNYIDATLGEGGHSLEILKHILPEGHLLGIDFDPRNIEFVKNRFLSEEIPESNFTLVNDNFKNLTEIVKNQKFTNVFGILFDLGLNSYFLDESKRGFSFRFDEPLDMRFDNKTSINAFDVVNNSTKDELEQILREYGEESFAESISEQIIEARRIKEIKTTYELNDVIFKATPNWYHHRKIHSSTKTFMALRIHVNQEFSNLKTVLKSASEIVEKGGRIAIISFHSLEDRIIKNYFKELEQQKLFKPINKKTIVPKWTEVKQNKRSRSAKLRVIEKL